MAHRAKNNQGEKQRRAGGAQGRAGGAAASKAGTAAAPAESAATGASPESAEIPESGAVAGAPAASGAAARDWLASNADPAEAAGTAGAAAPDADSTSDGKPRSARKEHRLRQNLRRLRRQRERAETRKKPSTSYSRRVTSGFALTAAMTALILASILAVVWTGQFQSYTHENMERIAETAALQIGERYEVDDEYSAEALGYAASVSQMSPGLACRVVNLVGTDMYDDTSRIAEANGLDEDEVAAGATGDRAVTVPIVADGAEVGSLVVWPYGSGSVLSSYDAKFRFNSIRAVLIAAAIAIVIALFVGFVFARSLVDPLKRVTVAVNRVKEGDLSARTGLVGDDEISQLGETFDAMAESIEKDRKLERQLTTDVAHELRTPLMAIQANVEGMLDGVLPATPERLSVVDSETTRLSRLVSALLELSRLESGTSPFTFEQLDLSKLIGGLVESQQALFDGTGMTLEFDADSNVMVEGDADKLRQATVNLISNALRYTDDDGHVLVEVHAATATEAVISVTDDGIGIAPEDLQRVFSRFWRADEARDRESGGLGVGLSVVKEIVNRHHGRVDVHSTLGKGTTFYLYIPYKQPDRRRGARAKQQASRRNTTGRHDARAAALAARKAEKAGKRPRPDERPRQQHPQAATHPGQAPHGQPQRPGQVAGARPAAKPASTSRAAQTPSAAPVSRGVAPQARQTHPTQQQKRRTTARQDRAHGVVAVSTRDAARDARKRRDAQDREVAARQAAERAARQAAKKKQEAQGKQGKKRR